MQFEWSLNPASLLAILAAILTAIKFWWDNRNKAEQALKIAEDAMKEAKEAKQQVAILQGAFAAYREMQAERLVSREVLREVEGRMAKSIDGLGDRLDELINRLWNGPRPAP